MPGLTDAFAHRALADTVSKRHDAYVHDAQRIVDATFRLIERTGGIDPSLRDILAEANLSTQAFYRLFRSKDELMLVILDDGRRQLVGYLEHRMEDAQGPAAKVRAFVEGVMAQAQTPRAAGRTRPFVVNEDRLADAFPEEQRASVALLVDLVHDVTGDAEGSEAAYRLTFATLHDHLVHRTRPSGAEVERLVAFVLAGLGLGDATEAPRRPGRGRTSGG